MTTEHVKPCVLLTSNQYKPNIGGIENSLYHLAQEYLLLGYEVVIVASDLNPENKELPEVEIEEGVTIYRYCFGRSRGLGRVLKQTYNAVRLYKKVLQRHSPVLTICRFHFNVLYLKALKYKNIVYLVPGVVANETKASYRANDNKLLKLKGHLSFFLHKTVQRMAFNSADKLFVFSENMQQQIRNINRSKAMSICKPGVSLSRFSLATQTEKSQLKKELGLPEQSKAFLCIGRFVKAKGFDTAIEALKLLNDNNASLWLLGEGAEEAELRALSERLNVSDRVIFLGRQSCPENYYKAADFFIMSSTYEPLGQTILEALSSGLPIIGAKSSSNVVTATSEILEPSNNILVDEYSASAFARGMTSLMALSETQYTQLQYENRELAEQRFSWRVLAKELAGDF